MFCFVLDGGVNDIDGDNDGDGDYYDQHRMKSTAGNYNDNDDNVYRQHLTYTSSLVGSTSVDGVGDEKR